MEELIHAAKGLVFAAINLGLLIALLVWKTKQPLRDYVAQRAEKLRHEVQSVSELLQKAKIQNEEFTAKLKAIDAEVISMRQTAQAEAEASKKRLIEDARRLAQVIVSDAKRAAEAAGHDLKIQLRAELANKVVQTAEAQIRQKLTGDDRARMRREFSRQVETVA
jgi:F-type H+-transporting ATPase subunit b